MKYYIKLARPHHWVKNVLVLLPLLCSGQFLEWGKLRSALWGFFAFSLLASAIYVINDIQDREKDRRSTTKCHRPIAAGTVSVSQATVFCIVLLLLAGLCGLMAAGLQWKAWCALGAYFLLNLAYSLGLKNQPLVDIAILVSGYLLRMLYGGAVTDIVLSKWLCLTVTAMSFYLGLGKRRGELLGQKEDTRVVLKFYSRSFLDQNMYMCAALAVVFYSLWTVDAMTTQRVGSENLLWTVPLVILICMKYSLDVEGDSDGDPVEVLLHDKVLLLLGAVLALVIFSLIYL
jgi:4-hydroxybenzoate polyprenyltransferase